MPFKLTNAVAEEEATSSFSKSLLDFIEEEESEEYGTGENENFTISSPDQANYYIKKVKETRDEIAEVEATAKKKIEEYVDKVNRWRDSVTAPLENRERYFTNLLEVYAATTLEGTSKKSLKLIEGTLGFKKQIPQYNYEDEVLLEFAKTSAMDYVKTALSVDKGKLKKEATVKSGKLYIGDVEVKGVSVVAREDKFDVK